MEPSRYLTLQTSIEPSSTLSRVARVKETSRTGTFAFLSLPAELRDTIYRYSVIFRKSIQPRLQSLDANYRQAVVSTAWCPSLLLVNRQIYAEALDVLYANNTIVLRDRPIYPTQLYDKARLLESIFRGQIYKSLFVRVGTLHVRIGWLFSNDWSRHVDVDSCWYRRSGVERLKWLVDSIAKELSSGQPDRRKTLVLEFPCDHIIQAYRHENTIAN